MKTIHRRARNGFTLCGKFKDSIRLTLNDCEVTCEECLKILNTLTISNTKTSIIKKFTKK